MHRVFLFISRSLKIYITFLFLVSSIISTIFLYYITFLPFSRFSFHLQYHLSPLLHCVFLSPHLIVSIPSLTSSPLLPLPYKPRYFIILILIFFRFSHIPLYYYCLIYFLARFRKRGKFFSGNEHRLFLNNFLPSRSIFNIIWYHSLCLPFHTLSYFLKPLPLPPFPFKPRYFIIPIFSLDSLYYFYLIYIFSYPSPSILLQEGEFLPKNSSLLLKHRLFLNNFVHFDQILLPPFSAPSLAPLSPVLPSSYNHPPSFIPFVNYNAIFTPFLLFASSYLRLSAFVLPGLLNSSLMDYRSPEDNRNSADEFVNFSPVNRTVERLLYHPLSTSTSSTLTIFSLFGFGLPARADSATESLS